MSIEDYKAFPFDKVQSFKNNKSKRELFQKLGLTKKGRGNIFLSRKLLDETLYFIKWKNGYWLKKNFSIYKQIWKEFQPTVFSKRTLRNLQKK